MHSKIPVAVLGASGLVGQTLIKLLQDHPFFDVEELIASPSSEGKTLKERLNSHKSKFISQKMLDLKFLAPKASLKSQIMFSALPASVAKDIESSYLQDGKIIISNARNFRLNPNVPILIPEINSSHFDLLKSQKTAGKIITNPNCVVAGLAPALSLLDKKFGLLSVNCCSLQAISGAGLEIIPQRLEQNTWPHIEGEETKIEIETKKILGRFNGNYIEFANIDVAALCHRVPVFNGHTLSVFATLKKPSNLNSIHSLFRDFKSPIAHLPSAPKYLFKLFEDPMRPQALLDRELGMQIGVGKMKLTSPNQLQLNLFLDNLVRGAAGAALLNAEFYFENKLKDSLDTKKLCMK